MWQPRRLNPHRVGALVHEARLYADPDRAIADHDAALETRKVDVRLDRGAPGAGEVFMTLDTADAIAFDHTISKMAATMRSLGHEGELGSGAPTLSGCWRTRRPRWTCSPRPTSLTRTGQWTPSRIRWSVSPMTWPTSRPTRSGGRQVTLTRGVAAGVG